MGTMVTMVLLVAVLILGGYMVNRIFSGGLESVDQINTQVKSEITKLFSEDSSKKIIIYPQSRIVNVKKGDTGVAFSFALRNVEKSDGEFTYTVAASETDCTQLTTTQADSFIGLGKTGTRTITAGSIMDDPIHVVISVPESAPPCSVRYLISVDKAGALYLASPVSVDLIIK